MRRVNSFLSNRWFSVSYFVALPITLSRASLMRAIFTRIVQTGVDRSRQESRLMTREELRANQEHMWQALSAEQSMVLALAMEMLLRCHLSPYQILTKTMTALEGLQHDS